MRFADLLPDFMLSPQQRAERDLDTENRAIALEGLHARHEELRVAEAAFEGTAAFMEVKAAELRKIQDALVFSRGDETLILQGRAMSLYEFVKTPERIKAERVKVEQQINEIENPTPG